MSSEVTSLVNTRAPKTRRAVIAILGPAKTSFPGLVCHSAGLVVEGCQFTALFTTHALLGFASRSPTAMSSKVPLPAFVVPEIRIIIKNNIVIVNIIIVRLGTERVG